MQQKCFPTLSGKKGLQCAKSIVEGRCRDYAEGEGAIQQLTKISIQKSLKKIPMRVFGFGFVCPLCIMHFHSGRAPPESTVREKNWESGRCNVDTVIYAFHLLCAMQICITLCELSLGNMILSL